jgi:hypothetical protein
MHTPYRVYNLQYIFSGKGPPGTASPGITQVHDLDGGNRGMLVVVEL